MNEQIKKLAKDHLVRDERTESGWQECHKYEFDESELEKFAELIIKECLEQIDKIRDGCEADNEDQQALGADWAGLAVARHFGVEE